MSTNNSDSTQKKELKVIDGVREAEILEHVKGFTKNDSTIIVNKCLLTGFLPEIEKDNEGTEGILDVEGKGTITTEEIEKGNAVTLLIKTLQKFRDGKDGKNKKSRESEEAAEQENNAEHGEISE